MGTGHERRPQRPPDGPVRLRGPHRSLRGAGGHHLHRSDCRCRRHGGADQGRGPGRRLDPCSPRPPPGGRDFWIRTLVRYRSRRSGGGRRRLAGRNPDRRFRHPAPGRDRAVAWHRDHGRAGGKDHIPEHAHSRRQGPGVHHLSGRPDGDVHSRGSRRAGNGRPVPVPRPIRTGRHPSR